MNSRAEQLIDYLADTKQADELNKQISEISRIIKTAERALEMNVYNKTVEETICKELHSLRLRKIETEINLNELERKILKFELTEELAN